MEVPTISEAIIGKIVKIKEDKNEFEIKIESAIPIPEHRAFLINDKYLISLEYAVNLLKEKE